MVTHHRVTPRHALMVGRLAPCFDCPKRCTVMHATLATQQRLAYCNTQVKKRRRSAWRLQHLRTQRPSTSVPHMQPPNKDLQTAPSESDTSSVSEEHKDALGHYLKGDVVEVEESELEEETPGASSLKAIAKVTGAVVGAVIGGAAGYALGVPLIAAAAAVGAVAGVVAGSAVAKEWVRGENISSAMEFDQPDEAPAGEGNATSPAEHRHHGHIFSVGNIRRKVGQKPRNNNNSSTPADRSL